MSSIRSVVLAVALLMSGSLAQAAEIKIVPGDFIVLNPTNPDKGYSDFLIHSIVLATGAHETLRLMSLEVDVIANGHTLLTRSILPDEMVGTSRFLASAPIPEFVDGQLLDPDGLAGLFGRPVTFAQAASMAPSQALIAARLHFSVGFVPDTVRVSATLSNAQGSPVTEEATVPIRVYKSPIVYRPPLNGTWMMQALPGVQSHHRFNPSTEYAVDFFKQGPDGHVAHGDIADARNFYGYGAPVMAAAPGTVVAVIADQVQDRAALLRKPGEPLDAFLSRVDAFHMVSMKRNFRAANAGNLVTIRHEAAGVIEYSSYGHLKTGSVRVKLGDRVLQGQVIGEVGDTGDSAAVHLHFQVNAGPDAFTSKSLPAVLIGLNGVDDNREPGLLVTTSDEQSRF
jgi:murein DD-endopeptidase MepM/ murein hydrolase activator NlpD